MAQLCSNKRATGGRSHGKEWEFLSGEDQGGGQPGCWENRASPALEVNRASSSEVWTQPRAFSTFPAGQRNWVGEHS